MMRLKNIKSGIICLKFIMLFISDIIFQQPHGHYFTPTVCLYTHLISSYVLK